MDHNNKGGIMFGESGCSVTKEAMIPAAVNKCEMALQELAERLSILSDRLVTVLVAPTPQVEKTKEECIPGKCQPTTPLAARVDTITANVEELIRRVNNALDRLEL